MASKNVVETAVESWELPRCDSADSNLSYISASHSLDDTFLVPVSEDALEDVKESLNSLLKKHRSHVTDVYNNSGLITLLGECLDEYNQEVDHWKQNCSVKDTEIADLMSSYEEKLKVLDENRERISNIISSNEKQLSTALERAVNSRRQAETLQIQLNDARSKIFTFEQKNNENYLSLISHNESRAEQYFEEKLQLLNKITLLEDEVNKLRENTAKLSEENSSVKDKLQKETLNQSEILNESENALKFIQLQLVAKEKDIFEERKLNKTLLDENNSYTQENAILKAKLELTIKDLEHCNKINSILKAEKRELMEKSSLINHSKYTSLMEEIGSNDKEIDQLLETLNEKLKMKVNIANQLLEVENNLKKKSVEIQMNSDRIANFNRRLKHLDEEILNTSTALKSREKQLKTLSDKLQARETQLENLARKTQDGRVKVSELDNSLKLSVERERKLSERLRMVRKEEAQIENDITVHQNRSESLLKVLQSRKNIIQQLEIEDQNSGARLNKLFDKTLPVTSDTMIINESKRLSSGSSNSESFSGIAALNNSSLDSMMNQWQCASDTNFDQIDMSLSECVPDNILLNQTTRNNSDMDCSENKYDNAILLSQNPLKLENELPSLSPSDTDSGISFLTEGVKANHDNVKHLQSTPFHSKSNSFSKKEELSPIVSSSDKYNLNLASRPAAVSINIYQATGRMRHNSLPSSAAKNRPRYKTKFQECLPVSSSFASSQFPTQEQSSQTATSSFIESYKFHHQTEQFERLPADGVEPLQIK